MANRHAPYSCKYQTREPKKLIGVFTVTNAAAATVSLAAGPHNKGIYEVEHTGTGVYKIKLGSSATSLDPYYKLGGVHLTFTEVQRQAYVSNNQVSNNTTPFVEITVCSNASATVNVANDQSCYFELTLLDSNN